MASHTYAIFPDGTYADIDGVRIITIEDEDLGDDPSEILGIPYELEARFAKINSTVFMFSSPNRNLVIAR